MQKKSSMNQILIGLYLWMVLRTEAFANSVDAWQDYQANQDPMNELLLFIMGVAIFIGLLWGLNKLTQPKKKKKRR